MKVTAPPVKCTNCSHPWALVRYGGDAVGKWPRTRLAFSVSAVAVAGEIIGYDAYTAGADGAWTKSKRRFEPATIIQTWRRLPTAGSLRRARAGLVPVASVCDGGGR